MHSKSVNPIVWDETMGMFLEDATNYTGAHTKKTGRIASDTSVQHFIARQLQLIAQALASYDEVESDTNTEFSKQVLNRSSDVYL